MMSTVETKTPCCGTSVTLRTETHDQPVRCAGCRKVYSVDVARIRESAGTRIDRAEWLERSVFWYRRNSKNPLDLPKSPRAGFASRKQGRS